MSEHEHSYAMYQRLLRRRQSCAGCRVEAARYQREHRRNNEDVRRGNQARNEARRRAMGRLARLHPDEFRRLLHEELTKLHSDQ